MPHPDLDPGFEGPLNGQLHGAHILVIDDDSAQRAALRRVLRRSGYRISTASNGREGLRSVLSLSPDLILLDVTMPVVSGHEFLRRLRRLERRMSSRVGASLFHSPPVIFVSARKLTHQRVDGLDAGAADYITKPFDADELRARVRRTLRDEMRSRASDQLSLSEDDSPRLRLHGEMNRCTHLMQSVAEELARTAGDGSGADDDLFAELLGILEGSNNALQNTLDRETGEERAA